MGGTNSKPEESDTNGEENGEHNAENIAGDNVGDIVEHNSEENGEQNAENIAGNNVGDIVEHNSEENGENNEVDNHEEQNMPTEPPRRVPSATRDVGTCTDYAIQAVMPTTPQNNEILYVNEMYDYLFEVERRHPIARDHLAGQTEVTYNMRAVLINWINEAHLDFELQAETFQLTVGIIDRYLQKVKDTKRTALQLVGVTALYIAAKYGGRYKPSISMMATITDNAYTDQEIRQMELVILKKIDYNLSRPVPHDFLQRCLKAGSVPANEFHYEMSLYFIELAAVEYDLSSYRPSEIAAAALFLALHLLTSNLQAGMGFNDQLWSPALIFYSHYPAAHLRPITWQMAKLAKSAPQARLRAVFIKYQGDEFHKVALRTQLADSWLDALIAEESL